MGGIDGATDVALNGLARGRQEGEDGSLQAVAILLLVHGDVQSQGRGAEGHAQVAFACLAGSTQHFDVQAKHQSIGQRLGRNIFKRYAREERTAVVGLKGVDGELRRIVVAEPPEIGVGELIGSRDTGIADGHAVVADGLARERDAVLRPLQGGRFVHLHFEGRALVFLHAEADTAAVGLNAIDTGQASFRQGEICGEDTHGVRGDVLITDDLPVGIAKMQVEGMSGFGLGVPVQLVVGNTAEVNRLPGAIDGAVGVEANRQALLFFVQRGHASPQRFFREIVVLDGSSRGG